MRRIEDYAMLSDLQTAALVHRDGAIEWCCFPRFDSDACFASILGTDDNGAWTLTSTETPARVSRRYLPNSFVLETTIETGSGEVRVIDFMPPRGESPDIVRIVEGVRGVVRMHTRCRIRFGYGRVVPRVHKRGDCVVAVAGPDAVSMRADWDLTGEDLATVSTFDVSAGERTSMVLTWYPSYRDLPDPVDAEIALQQTISFWEEWHDLHTFQGAYQEVVHHSLMVLKALTYQPSGGIVAAPTTSLPEWLGGVRNWDYRYCWLRDASLTLVAMMEAGHTTEALAWQSWLLRAIAGDPADLQIMYGIAGERWLAEREMPWLEGFEHSTPVRIGNAASDQLQLDVYGEVMEALYLTGLSDGESSLMAWSLMKRLLSWLETGWRQDDAGMWEVRGPNRAFTHSKLMCWVAFDRAVRCVQEHGLDGPVERWAELRDEIRDEILEQGWNVRKQSFTQYFGGDSLDANLLLMPIMGFIPADDPRMQSTVEAIVEELMEDGLLLRYRVTHEEVDGLPPGEGAFLACSFWLVEVYALQGRIVEARELFERLIGYRNDLGLLAEEYDVKSASQLGNFPQAFTHLALVTAALELNAAMAGTCDNASQSHVRSTPKGSPAP